MAKRLPMTVAFELAGRDSLIHGITGDSDLVFVTEPMGGRVVASDQEHRFSGINQAIPTDMFQLPFLVTKVLVTN